MYEARTWLTWHQHALLSTYACLQAIRNSGYHFSAPLRKVLMGMDTLCDFLSFFRRATIFLTYCLLSYYVELPTLKRANSFLYEKNCFHSCHPCQCIHSPAVNKEMKLLGFTMAQDNWSLYWVHMPFSGFVVCHPIYYFNSTRSFERIFWIVFLHSS